MSTTERKKHHNTEALKHTWVMLWLIPTQVIETDQIELALHLGANEILTFRSRLQEASTPLNICFPPHSLDQVGMPIRDD